MTGDAFAAILFLVFLVAFVAALGMSKRRFKTIGVTLVAMFLTGLVSVLVGVITAKTTASAAASGAAAVELMFPVGTAAALIHAWRNRSQELTK